MCLKSLKRVGQNAPSYCSRSVFRKVWASFDSKLVSKPSNPFMYSDERRRRNNLRVGISVFCYLPIALGQQWYFPAYNPATMADGCQFYCSYRAIAAFILFAHIFWLFPFPYFYLQVQLDNMYVLFLKGNPGQFPMKENQRVWDDTFDSYLMGVTAIDRSQQTWRFD